MFLTNLFEALKALRLLPAGWKFASDNYQAIARATSCYRSPAWLPGLLFAGVILWQAFAVLAFWAALVPSMIAGSLDFAAINLAFAASLALWATFLLAGELFMAYESQPDHLLLFIGQLVTLLALHLLPA